MKVRSRFAFFRDKLQVFFLGLLLGLVLGGGFFVLKLDQYVKELSFYKSLTEKKDKNDLDVPELKTDTEKPKAKTHKKENRIQDSTNSSYSSNSNSSDTTSPYVYVGNNPNDNIVVRTDEMLGQKSYSVVSMDTKNPADSLSQPEIKPASVDIEFWLSPLNYHGYKFSRNKVVLFGYSQNDLVSVIKLDNVTFLKCLTGVFRLEPSADFRQMERVTDESLLSRLK
jgi:hypothetical protein